MTTSVRASQNPMRKLLDVIEMMGTDDHLVFVNRMPEGMTWCAYGNRIFISVELLQGSTGYAIHDAFTHVINRALCTRPRLVALPGGRDGQARPVRPSGSKSGQGRIPASRSGTDS